MTTSDKFERFIDFASNNGRYNDSFPSRMGYYLRKYEGSEASPRRYGDSKRTETMQSGSGEYHSIVCNYRVYVVKRDTKAKTNVYDCIDGLKWSVMRKFNKKALEFEPLEISRPIGMIVNEIFNYKEELTNYFKAVKANKKPVNDKQLQWFMSYPPLDTNINNL